MKTIEEYQEIKKQFVDYVVDELKPLRKSGCLILLNFYSKFPEGTLTSEQLDEMLNIYYKVEIYMLNKLGYRKINGITVRVRQGLKADKVKHCIEFETFENAVSDMTKRDVAYKPVRIKGEEYSFSLEIFQSEEGFNNWVENEMKINSFNENLPTDLYL